MNLVRNFDKAIARHGAKVGIGALNATLNKTIITVRAGASKQVTSQYAIKARDVKKTMTTKRSSFSNLRSELTSADSRLPLALFSPTQKKKGVSVKVKKRAPRQVVRHAFIATMRNGHVGVFTTSRRTLRNVRRRKRVPRRGPAPNYSELPIDEAITIAIPQVWDLRESEREAAVRAPIVFEREMTFRLDRALKSK